MQQSNLVAKVVSTGGIAVELSHAKKGMVGISISNHFFSNDRVMSIVKLGLELCDDFGIIIFDYPERWNWPLKQHTSRDKNEKQCRVIGQEKKSAYLRQLKKLGLEHRVPVLTWADIIDQDEYKRNLAAVREEFATNTSFRTAITGQLEANLGDRLKNLSANKSDILLMHNYLLEEIAGLFYLQLDLGYQLDLYPKPQMAVVQAIYLDQYPEISKKLGYDWSKQGWVEDGF